MSKEQALNLMLAISASAVPDEEYSVGINFHEEGHYTVTYRSFDQSVTFNGYGFIVEKCK